MPRRSAIQVRLDDIRTVAKANNVETSSPIRKHRHYILEYTLNVGRGALVAGDAVYTGVDIVAEVSSARHGRGIEGKFVESSLALGPPDELAHVGEDDTWRRGIGGRALLLAKGLHDRD